MVMVIVQWFFLTVKCYHKMHNRIPDQMKGLLFSIKNLSHFLQREEGRHLPDPLAHCGLIKCFQDEAM